MPDNEAENKAIEKSVESKPQESSEPSTPQEKPTTDKPVELRESFANKAGDQGVSFNPAIGINTPDPFVSQDETPSQTSPAQTIAPTPSTIQPTTIPTPVSSEGDTNSGE